MENAQEKIKKELSNLIKCGRRILVSEIKKRDNRGKNSIKGLPKGYSPPISEYQSWYTTSLSIVKQLIPERYQEFQELYKKETRRKEINVETYTISDYLIGLNVYNIDCLTVFLAKFHHQIAILNSVMSRIDSFLIDIQGILQYELFDNELEAAEELLKNGYLRPAGVLAGVTLETHLSKVMEKHNLKITKIKPSISDYNDKLKKNNIYDIPDWRFIQRLGDIRNLCAHKKEREPKKDEVRELIDGVQKVIKTIF